MFDIGFNPMASQLNGFTTYVMDSSEKADEIIDYFEKAIAAGIESDEALKQALRNSKVALNDLTYIDRNRVERKVEEVASNSFNSKRRDY